MEKMNVKSRHEVNKLNRKIIIDIELKQIEGTSGQASFGKNKNKCETKEKGNRIEKQHKPDTSAERIGRK